ncbi:MAG: ABC transporter ATP-binding protein [Dictyoglomi bacterium]|nr:ABC transporter ATP-binding protein [Dictyoglomota bacterium]
MGRVIVERLTVKYGDRVVLRSITLSFNKPGFVAIVGTNGAGKSTFAKALVGVLNYDGRIYDEDTNSVPRAGYVWQNPEWGFIGSTVWEEVVLSYLLKGFSHADAYSKAETILKQFGLYSFRDREVHTLSGGYKQVLAIVTMMVLSPGVIVFDEVTSMLDTKERYMILGYLRNLSKKLLIFLITQRSEDLKYADRVIGIKDGAIAFDGFPESLWEEDYQQFGLTLPLSYKLTRKWNIPWKPLGILWSK